jgi:hypothetical protein
MLRLKALPIFKSLCLEAHDNPKKAALAKHRLGPEPQSKVRSKKTGKAEIRAKLEAEFTLLDERACTRLSFLGAKATVGARDNKQRVSTNIHGA